MKTVIKILVIFSFTFIVGLSFFTCDNGTVDNYTPPPTTPYNPPPFIPPGGNPTNQTPVASDFDIHYLYQTVGSIIPVSITPKTGKSAGSITIFYNGSSTLPTTAGEYTITFNVAASTGWNAVIGLAGGTLVISPYINAQNPIITNQPVSSTLTVNTPHSLSVIAAVTDGGMLTYQWYSNTSQFNDGGTIISGATSASYNPPTSTIGTFFFFVEIKNTITDNGDGGNKTAIIRSNAVTLTINEQVNAQTPSILTHPVSATVNFNASHSLSVTASITDGGMLSYQWYSNTSASNIGGTVISGATSASFNPLTSIAGTFYYFVEVTNTISNNGDGGNKSATNRSNVATFTVNAQVNAQIPNISSQPATATVNFNASHSLSVTANVTDGGTLSYRWYSNTSASNVGGTVIGGATSSSYSPPTGAAGTFYYFVEIINTIPNNGDGGNKTATIRSNAVTLTINAQFNAQTPSISTHPVSATVNFNSSHSLSVTASITDGGMLSYQWYSNSIASNVGGSVISGATSASYNPLTSTAGTFYYFVEVTNTIPNNGDGGNKTASIRSNAVTFNVNPRVNAQPPNVLTQPIGGNVASGSTYDLSIVASSSDGGMLSYQWYRNTSLSNVGGTVITGATSVSYNPPTGTAGSFFYFVQIINSIPNNGDGGTKTSIIRSDPVEICVISPNGIIINLSGFDEWNLIEQNVQVTANSDRIFTVNYNWSHRSFKWYLDGTLVGTTSSYTFNEPANVYQLVVIVTNNNGESRSGRCRITAR